MVTDCVILVWRDDVHTVTVFWYVARKQFHVFLVCTFFINFYSINIHVNIMYGGVIVL